MFERLLNWFRSRDEDDDDDPAHGPMLSRSGAIAPQPGKRPAAPRRAPAATRAPTAAAPLVRVKPGRSGEIADLGPGKNVLVRDPNERENSGSHEALIFFEEDVKASDETGIDPYNTGKFDRSRNWDKRFR